MTITIDEGDRQLVLLSLATLALHRPGFDYALYRLADKLVGTQMYEMFKELDNDGIKKPEPLDLQPLPGCRGVVLMDDLVEH